MDNNKDMKKRSMYYDASCNMERFKADIKVHGIDNMISHCKQIAHTYLRRYRPEHGPCGVGKIKTALWYLNRAKELTNQEYPGADDEYISTYILKAEELLTKQGGDNR